MIWRRMLDGGGYVQVEVPDGGDIEEIKKLFVLVIADLEDKCR